MKERTTRDQREAKMQNAWNNRYSDPMAAPVSHATREFNFSPAQLAVDRAHAVDSSRWGHPAAFMEAQTRELGVEVPQFPKASGVAFDARMHSANGVDRPNM